MVIRQAEPVWSNAAEQKGFFFRCMASEEEQIEIPQPLGAE